MGKLRPYLKANIWQNFSSDQTVSFGTVPIVTDLKGTSLEIGGGLTLDVTEKASLLPLPITRPISAAKNPHLGRKYRSQCQMVMRNGGLRAAVSFDCDNNQICISDLTCKKT